MARLRQPETFVTVLSTQSRIARTTSEEQLIGSVKIVESLLQCLRRHSSKPVERSAAVREFAALLGKRKLPMPVPVSPLLKR